MKLVFKKQEGLSILQIIASILLLSIIIISFLPLFIHSGKAIEKSEDVIKGTYSAQNLMEEIYEISNNNIGFKQWLGTTSAAGTGWQHITPDQNCQKHFQKTFDGIIANMYISKTSDEGLACVMPEERTMKNVRITISTSNKPTVIESQMETILIWEN